MLNKLSEATGNRFSVEELKQYQVFTEVPLETTNGYMKADIVLVKVGAGEKIQDVIVIENKLSKGTAYTVRQKEGFGAILKNGSVEMTVKSSNFKWKKIPVNSENIYKINDHGMPDCGIEKIKIERISKI
ncbi:MAG: hypothetical protein K5757_10355 [Bacteroidaceae bacterium]|nr:hypothetical protein [Bacteroidaceae bacterium]